MKRTNLRSTVARITQNKRVRAIALEVINGRASVKIIGSSKPLYNLPVTGGAIVAGQEVYVDYTTGTPVVHSYQESVESGTVTRVSKVRSIISDPDIPSSSNTFIEAPVDDKTYGRKNAAWIEVTSGSGTSGSGIEEAPINGKEYVRKDGDWLEHTSGSDSGVSDHESLTGIQGGAVGEHYHLTAAQLALIGASSGSGITDHTELTNIGTNTHDQIDTALTRLANTSGSNTGDQTLAGLGGIGDAPADSKEYLRKDNSWVEHTSGSGTTSGSGIEEAPIDGKEYVRKDAEWVEHTSGSNTSGSQIVPNNHPAEDNKFLTGYDNTTGEFTSGSPLSQLLSHGISLTFGNGSSVITSGSTIALLEIPFDVQLDMITIITSGSGVTSGSVTSGSTVIDIWQDTYANLPLTSANSILTGDKIVLSNTIKYQDNTFSIWTKSSFSQGDILYFQIKSNQAAARISIMLRMTRILA